MRRSIRGDDFLTHPISAVLMFAAVISLIWPVLTRLFGGTGQMLAPVAEEVQSG